MGDDLLIPATEIKRQCPQPASDKAARTEAIALALSGVAVMPAGLIGAGSSWEGRGPVRIGPEAIAAGLSALMPPERIEISDIVTHGRAGTVSGRIWREGRVALFCHVIRYTSAAAREVAQMVSFEHQERASG